MSYVKWSVISIALSTIIWWLGFIWLGYSPWWVILAIVALGWPLGDFAYWWETRREDELVKSDGAS